MEQAIKAFRALGDETRLRIYRLLSEKGELCVCHIMDTLKISQTHASRALGLLKNSGLVKDRKDGLWIHYSAVKDDPGRAISKFARALTRADKTLGKDLKKAKIVIKKKAECCMKFRSQDK